MMSLPGPLLRREFRLPRSRPASIATVSNGRTASPVPWQSGRALTWDVTVATTLADSCVPASSVTAAAAAEAAASRKEVKYSDLPASFSFQPIAVETLGPINETAVDFLRELGRRISSKFQEKRQSAYLSQSQ